MAVAASSSGAAFAAGGSTLPRRPCTPRDHVLANCAGVFFPSGTVLFPSPAVHVPPARSQTGWSSGQHDLWSEQQVAFGYGQQPCGEREVGERGAAGVTPLRFWARPIRRSRGWEGAARGGARWQGARTQTKQTLRMLSVQQQLLPAGHVCAFVASHGTTSGFGGGVGVGVGPGDGPGPDPLVGYDGTIARPQSPSAPAAFRASLK